ncbi:MAG: methyl-accepting chemotaxis protein, partial [Burkholderiales bacterium PBB5]
LFVAALMSLSAFSAWRSADTQAEADRALTEVETKIRLASRWSSVTEATVARALAGAISADPGVTAAFKDINADAILRITELQKQLGALPKSDADKAQVAKIAAERKVTLELSGKITELRDAGKVDDARALAIGPFSSAANTYLASLREFVAMQERNAQTTRQQLGDARRQTVVIAAVLVGLIVVGALVGTALMVRSIQAPVQQAIQLAAAIADGDLSQRPEIQRGDEFGELMRALVAMGDALGTALGQVRQASDSIHTASAEIASGNTDLSHRTEQTASNLQQTASSITQLSGTVRQSADAAQTANQLAQSAAQVAQRGGAVVAQVISTMDAINTSSKRIADINGTI